MAPRIAVPAPISDDWQKGRRNFQEFVANTSLTGEALEKALSVKAKKWSNQDSTVLLDEAVFLALRGDEGARLLEDMIVMGLPTLLAHQDLAACKQNIEGNKKHGLYEFGGKAAKTALDSAVDLVDKMQGGETINIELLKNDVYVKRLVDRLAWACKHTEVCDKKGKSRDFSERMQQLLSCGSWSARTPKAKLSLLPTSPQCALSLGFWMISPIL